MGRNKAVLACFAVAGIQVVSKELVRDGDVDAAGLSLLQMKAVVSRKAQEDSVSMAETENEWPFQGMFSSVIDAVQGAFHGETQPVADGNALKLMESQKTVVTTKSATTGILHLVHSCNQCGFNFCEKKNIKESKMGIEKMYQSGSILSDWGCDKVVNPYIIHDKGSRKMYAVEFIESQAEESESSATRKHSQEKASSASEKHSQVKEQVKSAAHTKAQGKHSLDSISKDATEVEHDSSKWPDFSFPRIGAKSAEKTEKSSVEENSPETKVTSSEIKDNKLQKMADVKANKLQEVTGEKPAAKESDKKVNKGKTSVKHETKVSHHLDSSMLSKSTTVASEDEEWHLPSWPHLGGLKAEGKPKLTAKKSASNSNTDEKSEETKNKLDAKGEATGKIEVASIKGSSQQKKGQKKHARHHSK